MSDLAGLLRQGFVVIGARGGRIERQIELIFPAEFETCLGHGVIADLRARMAFGQIGGVSGDLVGDQALLDVLFVRQAEVFFRRDVTQHGAAEPADHCRADAGGEMVIARGDIGGQRAEGVERRFVAMFQLFGHVAADHLHRHMARAFNHHLYVVFPGDFGQLAQRMQLGELGLVVGVLNRTGAQAVAERQRTS